jgi:5-methylcytosine-specific restriction endonuclease McrA
MPHTLEQKRLHSQKVRAERKQYAHKFLGGSCSKCGSTNNLEMDHLDPATKVNNVSRMFTYSMAKFMAELRKCQLLCTNCHRERTKLQSLNVVSNL